MFEMIDSHLLVIVAVIAAVGVAQWLGGFDGLLQRLQQAWIHSRQQRITPSSTYCVCHLLRSLMPHVYAQLAVSGVHERAELRLLLLTCSF